MVNICEPLINFVKAKQAKVADRLEPKRCAVGYPSPGLGVHGHKTAGEEAEPNLSC